MKEYSLCKLCAQLLVCDRAKEQNQKVYYCEEFQKSEIASERRQTIYTENNQKHKVNNMQNGLCRICENRDICKIEIPAGGLWHCENFL